MQRKIVEWTALNWYIRFHTAWVFIRASWRMIIKGRASISVEFINL